MPISTPVFCTPLDNMTTTVAVMRSSGSPTLTVASGTGALFGSTFPIRVTCQRVSDQAYANFKVTDRSGDVLTLAVSDGYSELSLSVGDNVGVLYSAATITDIHAPILSLVSEVNTLATEGVQGPQGSTGIGSQGPQGSTGIGTQGPQGNQGSIGIGSQGPQGNEGSIGIGSQGPQGAIGVQGTQGSSSGGSGGSPGGSNGSIQFNNAGSLAGSGTLDSLGQMAVGGIGTTPFTVNAYPQAGQAMTSINTPAPLVAGATSQINSDNPPWKAFDRQASAANNTRWIPATTGTESLLIDYGSGNAFVCSQYGITSAESASCAPTAWTFNGSNDGSTWTTLDTKSGVTWSSGWQQQIFPLGPIISYQHYMLTITAYGGGGLIEVGELSIFHAQTSGLVVSNTGITSSLPLTVASDTTISGSLYCGNFTIETNWINVNGANAGIGTGGPGNNPWVALASGPGAWFTNASTGDICYRNQTGNLNFGTTAGSYQFHINTSTVSVVSISNSAPAFKVVALSGQSADLTQWVNNSGTVLAAVDANGFIRTLLTSGMPGDAPATGSQAFDSSTNKLWIYNGSAWKSVTLS